MSYPRAARQLWSDSDYASAIEHIEAERDTFVSRFGIHPVVVALYTRELTKLREARKANNTDHQAHA